MVRLCGVFALMAMVAASSPAAADGALAVGSTSDVAKDGIAVGTFKGECYAVSFDPKPGTPGAGWAIAATKETAEERALENCKATAGAARREFCKIEESKCDEN